ncbi:MAG: carbohydrate-binding domain-containing protein [Clostridia bacterium]|nr:carbohydrate-binding domain-containing protein [Clostridia bacterium]
MKKLLALFLVLLVCVFMMISCGDDETSSSESSSSSSESSSSTSEESSSKDTQSSTSEKPNDQAKYPEVPKIDYNVDVNQTINGSIFTDFSAFGNEGEGVDYSSATNLDVSVGITNIRQPGTYRLSGTTTKGHVKIDIDRIDDTAPLEKVILILDNVNITSSLDASSIPPIYSKGCELVIIIPKGTTNTITDTKTNTQKGAIYVKTGNLTIEGEGTLKINAVYKNAIFNSKILTVNGGVFDITSEYNGIYGEDSVIINTGDFKIVSGKAAIKSGDFEEENLPEQNVVGSITLNGGKFDIDSQGDGIDCYGSVYVNGGGYNIETESDGIDATEKIVFGDDEKNTVMIIESKGDGLKAGEKATDSTATADASTEIVPNVVIKGKTNIKILTNNDGINADDVEIDMNGVLYIKTDASFIEDMSHGDYILDNKEYHKVDRTLYSGKMFFSIDGSNKGIKASNSIVIKNGQIAIDADEDAIVTTDGKAGNSATVNTIEISGGVLNLDARESAIKADVSITVSGTAKVNVIKSDKGLNAMNVTIGNGTVNLVAISDSIDATKTIINNGTVYLFDKVDYPTDGGVFEVNGGTVVCISTTKNPKAPTSSASKVITKAIENSTEYGFGKYINIKGESLDIVLKLPKKYVEKISVVVISPNLVAGTYTISAGDYVDGSVANLVCSGGTFTALTTESVTIQ